jgi:hypothetical protein
MPSGASRRDTNSKAARTLSAGIITNPAIKNDILNYYVLATGSDGYEAIFSLGELDPMFGGLECPT